MNFDQQLNEYILQIQCTAKELSEASGLSATVISRYRAGERSPQKNSPQAEKLASGICLIAKNKSISGFEKNEVLANLNASLHSKIDNQESFSKNFNNLISVLQISMPELSKSLNFDPSYLSRIRNGQRKPANIESFVDGVCHFVVRKYAKEAQRRIIAELINAPEQETMDDSACLKALEEWLLSESIEIHDYMADFLQKLDEFDLEEYISAIHFDELKVPHIPLQRPVSRCYFGLEEMKQGELDFFRYTVLSKNNAPVFMCSDMPMEDMAEDTDFGKKWMFAIAMTLKKGLHLNIIHNIERPFKELMLGLESWIPIYMTGQVSPYYLKGSQNEIYHHFTYVSGSAALSGECIDGFHSDGKYYLTSNKEDVAYYQNRAAHLLAKAQPLMEIYDKSKKNIFGAFLSTDSTSEGNRRSIVSSLPIYTIPPELLISMLDENSVSQEDSAKIIAFYERYQNQLASLLKNGSATDEITPISSDDFGAHAPSLSLSGMFYDKEIFYTKEQYAAHLDATRRFAEENNGYNLTINKGQAFRNINIYINPRKYVIISKDKVPTIHFVIKHPKLVDALSNFIPPVVE